MLDTRRYVVYTNELMEFINSFERAEWLVLLPRIVYSELYTPQQHESCQGQGPELKNKVAQLNNDAFPLFPGHDLPAVKQQWGREYTPSLCGPLLLL